MYTDITTLYQHFLQHRQIATDTRKLTPGCIFFALKGGNFNGNQFALHALQQGAAYAVVDELIDADNPRLLLVPDALTALQQLAKHYRSQLQIPVIAITGSNGKTTTKELVSAVLSSHFKTSTTVGNLNNHIGVPLTLLAIPPDTEIAVVEMGANHQKEIEGYCVYTQPTHGIITNCGKAHLEGFGGIEGVRKGKGELYHYIKANNGTIFAFSDYDYLHQMSDGMQHIVWYGTQEGTVTGHVVTSEPFLQVAVTSGTSFTQVNTQLVGAYNLPNVLCAIAIGQFFGVPYGKIESAIRNYTPSNSRSQLMQWQGNQVILDAYNANPTSMKAAIENFAALHATQKVIMIGGMMELGEASIAEHTAIIALLQQYQWHRVVLVGGDFAAVEHPYQYFNNASEAGTWLHEQQFNNAYLLIKGSRSMQMEKVLQPTVG